MVGLPKTKENNDAIWNNEYATISETLYENIVRLHNTPISILFDKDARFTLKFSTIFYPQQTVIGEDNSSTRGVVEILCIRLARKLRGQLTISGV